MGREVVQVQGHVPAAPDAVWSVVREFCGTWHPWLKTIREERGPQGALVRAFTVAGEDALYREQRTYFSDSDRVLGYTHLEGIRDCEAYDARLTISVSEAGGSVVGWTATVRAPAARLGAICEGTKAVFEAGIAALAGGLPCGLTPPILKRKDHGCRPLQRHPCWHCRLCRRKCHLPARRPPRARSGRRAA